MAASLSRREALAGLCLIAGTLALGGASKAFASSDGLLRPPGGQDETRFSALCIKCDRCRSICPTRCVRVTTVSESFRDARTPRIDFHKGACLFCGACVDACPTGALDAFDPEKDKIGVAVIDEDSCIAYARGACDKCRDSCDYGALSFENGNRPEVDAVLCNGCGACTNACTANVYLSFEGDRKRAIEVVSEESL